MGSERWLAGLEAVRASLKVVVVERAWDATQVWLVGMSKAVACGARMGSERWLAGSEAVRASLKVVVVERAWDPSAILAILAPAGLGRPRPESRRL